MDTAIQKKMMRLSLRKRLQSFTLPLISDQEEEIAQRILSEPEVQKAQRFFIYVSYGKEVPTQLLIAHLLRQGKMVCVPKTIDDGQMIPIRILSLQHVARGRCGTLEPRTSVPYEHTFDVGFVPGVAFDKKYNRLGKGGGYYDRFLAQKKCAQSIGFAWQQQCVDEVPMEKHDYRVNNVFTFSYTGSPHISPQNI